nr:A11 [uncultured bacterium]
MNATLLTAILLLSLTLSGCGSGDTNATKPSPTAEHSDTTAATDTHKAEGDDGHDAEEEVKEEGAVELTAEQIDKAGIGIAKVGPASIREVLPLYGVVAPNAERVLEVAARFPGVIREVRKQVGDPVRRGESLATVESNESLQTYAVVSPLNGVVTDRKANPGEQTGDKALFVVADLSTVWVELSLFPRDVAKVRIGQAVRIKSPEADLSADGKVIYVAPFGSSANQTLTARVLLDNAERRWSPGLYVTAEVTLSAMELPLVVRNQALQTVEGSSVVFVRTEHGFVARKVAIGQSDGDISEVREGLQAGESYATSNSFILKSELGKGEAEHGH